MELPLGSQAGRKPTHDFLSLYSSSAAHTPQDPTPPQGGYLKTHDFLQPLERNEDVPPAEHVLPGGIGTYSITYFNQSPETAAFTLWDESAVRKGKTGKENISAEAVAVGPQWTSNPSSTNFTSFSSSQPSSSSQKNQSFMDMITSARNDQEDDDDEEEDEFIIKKEPLSHSKGNLSVKVEAKTIDHKPNTPRSKHSATEQRRRSKINDRFQKLREIIPNSEQKRDKASFLLEVIEYVQFLQEKVNRYEGSYSTWNHEPSKMMHWKNSHITEGFLDQTRGALVFPTKVNESKAGVTLSLPMSGQNLVESDLSTATTLKERVQQPDLTSKAAAVYSPMCRKTSIAASSVSPKQPSQLKSCTADSPKLKDPELTIESGRINISSAYSQGLLNTLTQALQTSGVDLSQASISVQIDIGKKANGIPHSSAFVSKEADVGAGLSRPRAASAGEEYGHTLKKLRNS